MNPALLNEMDSVPANFNTIITGLFALILFSYYLLKKFRASGSVEAPQPRGAWPIIGHLPLLSGTRFPHLKLAKLADKYGPVFRIRIGIHYALVVNSSELTKELFTTNDPFVTNRPSFIAPKLMGYNNALFPFTPAGGPYWRKMRKLSISEFLSNTRLEQLKHARIKEVETSIKELYQTCKVNNKYIVDMKKWMQDLNLNVLLKMIIGKKYFGEGSIGDEKEGRRFQKLMKVFFYYMGTHVLRDAVPFLGWMDVYGHEKTMKATAKELDDIFGTWLEEHKRDRCNMAEAKEEKDFMDAMISHLDGKSIEGYDADTINKSTCLAMIGGNETVAAALTWAVSLLLNNQNALKKAKEELDKYVGKERLVTNTDINKLVYNQAIVKEALRLYPPSFIPGARQFSKDCNIGGYHVPKGTWLMINLWKIHRDPNVWQDPMEFKPERFLTTHKDVDARGHSYELLPFGGGRRACPAVSFSLQMIHSTLATLLHAFDISTPNNAPVDMSPGIGVSNMNTSPLELLVSPRLPPYCFE